MPKQINIQAVFILMTKRFMRQQLWKTVSKVRFTNAWAPEESVYKWYAVQDTEKDETVLYANFQGKNPNEENVEINVEEESVSCLLKQAETILP